MYQGDVKRRKINYERYGFPGGQSGKSLRAREGEMTEVNWIKLKQDCRICVGSMWCDEHARDYEKVERYRKRRGLV